MTSRISESDDVIGARIVRGVIVGFLAGLAFLALNAWFSASTGGPAVRPLGLISSIVLGADALPDDVNPIVGFLVHSGISVLYGVIFALVAPFLRTNAMVAIGGVVFGFALFVLNFLVLANTVLPQFQNPNLPVEFMAHLLFGVLLAFGFFSTGVRRHEPLFGRAT